MIVALILIVVAFGIGILIGLPDDCPKSYRHQWEFRYGWNNMLGLRSKFTGDLLSRKGKRCFHCGEFRFEKSDRDFIKDNAHVTEHEWVEPVCTWEP